MIKEGSEEKKEYKNESGKQKSGWKLRRRIGRKARKIFAEGVEKEKK